MAAEQRKLLGKFIPHTKLPDHPPPFLTILPHRVGVNIVNNDVNVDVKCGTTYEEQLH